MPFRVTCVEHTSFPDAASVTAAAADLHLTVEQICSIVSGFTSVTATRDGVGHQQVLAAELERHVEQSLLSLGLNLASKAVSPALGERVDFAAGHGGAARYLLGEIEFRPNFEKDLVKFAIASNRGRLGLGVLLVARERNEINPGYTSMPQYDKVVRTVAEFAPTFPLVVVGLSGLRT